MRGAGGDSTSASTGTGMTRPDGGRPPAPEAPDVTAEHRLLRVLRERERWLLKEQRLAQLGSWQWDMAAGRVTWSDELCRIHGVARQGPLATYEGLLSPVHPEDRSEIVEAIGDALRAREPFSLDYRIVRTRG